MSQESEKNDPVIYLEFSPEVEKLLINNKVQVQDILKKEGIPAEVSSEVTPYVLDDGSRTKDIGTIIAAVGAGSAAIVAVIETIRIVLELIDRKKHHIEIYEIHVNSKELKLVKRIELVPEKEFVKEEFEFSVGKKGIVIKFMLNK